VLPSPSEHLGQTGRSVALLHRSELLMQAVRSILLLPLWALPSLLMQSVVLPLRSEMIVHAVRSAVLAPCLVLLVLCGWSCSPTVRCCTCCSAGLSFSPVVRRCSCRLCGPYLPRKNRLERRRRKLVEGQDFIIAHGLPPRTKKQITHHQDTVMLSREWYQQPRASDRAYAMEPRDQPKNKQKKLNAHTSDSQVDGPLPSSPPLGSEWQSSYGAMGRRGSVWGNTGSLASPARSPPDTQNCCSGSETLPHMCQGQSAVIGRLATAPILEYYGPMSAQK